MEPPGWADARSDRAGSAVRRAAADGWAGGPARLRAEVAQARSERVPAPGTLAPVVLARLGLAQAYAELSSAIGPVLVAWGADGVSALELAGDEPRLEADLGRRFGLPVLRSPGVPPRLAAAVQRHIAGRRDALRFDLRGRSTFERAVLDKALEIPPGEVRPYAWVAREIGRPRAVRAVGSALGRNPVPLLIPCHRVVRSDGRIGEYALGSARKRLLLVSEGVDPAELERLADRRVRFVGRADDRCFCLPTCEQVRQAGPALRVEFHTAAAAAAAGYLPCAWCRPVPLAVSA